jgi:hypothetical protein
VADDGLHQLELNLHPNEASGLLTVEDEPLLESHGWEFAFWAVLDEGEIEDCVAIIGHKRDAAISEGWEIERLHAEPPGDARKTEDAEAITRYDGWIHVFGSHFGSKDGPLQPKRGFVARFREAGICRGRSLPLHLPGGQLFVCQVTSFGAPARDGGPERRVARRAAGYNGQEGARGGEEHGLHQGIQHPRGLRADQPAAGRLGHGRSERIGHREQDNAAHGGRRDFLAAGRRSVLRAGGLEGKPGRIAERSRLARVS